MKVSIKVSSVCYRVFCFFELSTLNNTCSNLSHPQVLQMKEKVKPIFRVLLRDILYCCNTNAEIKKKRTNINRIVNYHTSNTSATSASFTWWIALSRFKISSLSEFVGLRFDFIDERISCSSMAFLIFQSISSIRFLCSSRMHRSRILRLRFLSEIEINFI